MTLVQGAHERNRDSQIVKRAEDPNYVTKSKVSKRIKQNPAAYDLVMSK